MKKSKIVIIGAGLAGLTCAYRLKEKGIDCSIYESSNRIGGRCFTIRNVFKEKQYAEAGGALIASYQIEILNLARELGLKLVDLFKAQKPNTEETYYFNGRIYPIDEATRDFQEIYEKVRDDFLSTDYPTLYNRFTQRGKELDNISIKEYIQQVVPGGINSNLGKLLDVAYAAEYGANTEIQSSLNLINLLGTSEENEFQLYGRDDSQYTIAGGCDLIASRLYEKLGKGSVIPKTPLIKIELLDNGQYKLGFINKRKQFSIIADYVVLTIPFSILSTMVDYSQAGFSKLKDKAIQTLGMGDNTKLNVQFNKRYWNEEGNNGDTYADTGYMTTFEATRGQRGEDGILTNFIGGDSAARLNNCTKTNFYTRNFLTSLEPVVAGGFKYYNGKSVLSYWSNYIWTRGAYSFYRVGQYTQIAGAERLPQGNCFFAGEHTSIDSQGFLNGAVESGERVSLEVLERLK